MLIVIDGYNLLRHYESSGDEKKRLKFIKYCIAYAKRKNHSLLVVFDAGPFIWPYKETASKLVTIAWAGMKQSADDYIKEMLVEGKKIGLLVTSDNEIKLAARQSRTDTINSKDFLAYFLPKNEIMQSVIISPVKKIGTQESPELDQLMEEAAALIEQPKVVSERVPPRSKADLLSKKERVQERKRKKL